MELCNDEYILSYPNNGKLQVFLFRQGFSTGGGEGRKVFLFRKGFSAGGGGGCGEEGFNLRFGPQQPGF